MKSIEKTKPATAPNAWGRDITSTSETLEIENSDVGREFPNFRGYQYSMYTFKASDVGRRIVRYFYKGWNSWVFEK